MSSQTFKFSEGDSFLCEAHPVTCFVVAKKKCETTGLPMYAIEYDFMESKVSDWVYQWETQKIG